MSKRSKFPAGWDDRKVKRVVEHYQSQTESEAVAEDETAARLDGKTLMEVPNELVPTVRDLIARRRKAS